MYLGDFPTGATVRFKFATNLATGARADPSSAWETADIRVYKGDSTTQRASEAGYTVTSTFDSMTGITHVAIDTSDNTDAGFFAAGSEYQVVLYPDETVDGVAVAAPVAHFSIERSGGALALLKDGTYGLSALETLVDGVETAAAAIEADTQDIQSRIPAALGGNGNMKADVRDFGGTAATSSSGRPEVNATHINASATAAARLALSAAQMLPGTVDNSAHTPTTTEFESDDLNNATADFYNGRLVIFTSGALAGQVTVVSDYAKVGSNGHFTVTALTNAPANDVTFILV